MEALDIVEIRKEIEKIEYHRHNLIVKISDLARKRRCGDVYSEYPFIKCKCSIHGKETEKIGITSKMDIFVMFSDKSQIKLNILDTDSIVKLAENAI
jgi:hypothetical protein